MAVGSSGQGLLEGSSGGRSEEGSAVGHSCSWRGHWGCREGVSRSSWGVRGGLWGRQRRGRDLPMQEVLSGPWFPARVPTKPLTAPAGSDPAPAHQDPLLQRDHCQLLLVPQLLLVQHRDPGSGQDPGAGRALHPGRHLPPGGHCPSLPCCRPSTCTSLQEGLGQASGSPCVPGEAQAAPCSVQDMNREVVKTDCASARIPELDFEVPAFSQKGGG